MKLFPQLTGVPQQSVNCGVSATRSIITWAARDAIEPGERQIRKRMGKPAGPTNPQDWRRAVESFDTPKELGGKYERLTCSIVEGGAWTPVQQHLNAGKAVIVAVHYGVYRRSMPRKSGSLSFDGLHAIAFRPTTADSRIQSFDSLLDGRYPGCPRGPVLVPTENVRLAAIAAGKKAIGRPSVFALLMDRATRLGGGVVLPDPDEPVSLSSVLADLWELEDAKPDPRLSRIILDLASLIGPYAGEADPDTEPEEGAKP